MTPLVDRHKSTRLIIRKPSAVTVGGYGGTVENTVLGYVYTSVRQPLAASISPEGVGRRGGGGKRNCLIQSFHPASERTTYNIASANPEKGFINTISYICSGYPLENWWWVEESEPERIPDTTTRVIYTRVRNTR